MTEIFANYPVDILIRMLMASLLGGMIGLERDMHGRAAGLRTHILVSLGAAIFTILSETIAHNATASGFTSDPGRIAAQIVTGIGFLGAGVIIKVGVNIRGLTTAACLWTAAAIGMAAGSGHYVIAVTAALIAMFGLVIMKLVERLYPKDTYRFLSVEIPIGTKPTQITDIVNRKHLKILHFDIRKNYQDEYTTLRLSLRLSQRGSPDKVAREIIESLEASAVQLRQVGWDHS